MISNPYKYTGALDPFHDQLVCLDRPKEINEVVRGFNMGNYWAILGPRQIGKTTFLRQLRKALPDTFQISVDLIFAPKSEDTFYKDLQNKMMEEILVGPVKIDDKWKDEPPDVRFHQFLKIVESRAKKKIVFFFDEIEELPYMRRFLHMWRHVHEESGTLGGPKMDIAVVISGSLDLIEATTGKSSPFNIAKHIFLKDFYKKDAEPLILKPLEKMEIRIDEDAKEFLINELNGHPQLLQHSLSRLVDMVKQRQDRKIIRSDIDRVLESLLRENTCIDLLRSDLNNNKRLELVLRSIEKGGKNPFHSYTELYVGGAGAITEDENGYCTIRNNLFRLFLRDYMAVLPPLDKRRVSSQVFVCGGKKDDIWRQQFTRYLSRDYEEIFMQWEDFKGKSEHEICGILENQIDRAELSIFLVSDDILRSGWLARDEILTLLNRKTKEGKNIFPLFVSGGAWEHIGECSRGMNKKKKSTKS